MTLSSSKPFLKILFASSLIVLSSWVSAGKDEDEEQCSCLKVFVGLLAVQSAAGMQARVVPSEDYHALTLQTRCPGPMAHPGASIGTDIRRVGDFMTTYRQDRFDLPDANADLPTHVGSAIEQADQVIAGAQNFIREVAQLQDAIERKKEIDAACPALYEKKCTPSSFAWQRATSATSQTL